MITIIPQTGTDTAIVKIDGKFADFIDFDQKDGWFIWWLDMQAATIEEATLLINWFGVSKR